MPPFVQETRFGVWFIGTGIWKVHVLRRALDDLERLIGGRRQYDAILDVGFGWGHSLVELGQRYHPQRLIGADPDPVYHARVGPAVERCSVRPQLVRANSEDLSVLPDNSFDLLFCHQTFHHVIHHEAAIAEFFRVLKPGGTLMFAESTRKYIHSWIVRYLFRHPMEVQKTTPEYIDLIRGAGFKVPAEHISFPYLWWSRDDLGVMEKLGCKVPEIGAREETLVNLVATKPA
jgi:ubiquinone/menaquinone biosynthesis C-methylase UbiE